MLEPLCVSLLSFSSPCFCISHSFLCGSFHQPSALPVCWERRSFSRPRMTYNYLVFLFFLLFFHCQISFVLRQAAFSCCFFSPLCSSELNKAMSRCPSTQFSYFPSSSLIYIRHVLVFHSRKSNSNVTLCFVVFFVLPSLVGSVILFFFFFLHPCRAGTRAARCIRSLSASTWSNPPCTTPCHSASTPAAARDTPAGDDARRQHHQDEHLLALLTNWLDTDMMEDFRHS